MLKEEIVQVQVHEENNFTNELKEFVLTNGNSNQIVAYDDKDLITLSLMKLFSLQLSITKLIFSAKIINNTN